MVATAINFRLVKLLGLLRPQRITLKKEIGINNLEGVFLLDKMGDELVREFYELLLKENGEEAIIQIFGAKTSAGKFVENLSNREFFYIYNAWRLGRDAIEVPDSFKKDLKKYNSMHTLFEVNLQRLKEFSVRSETEDQFTSKKNSIMRKYLRYYLEEISYYD